MELSLESLLLDADELREESLLSDDDEFEDESLLEDDFDEDDELPELLLDDEPLLDEDDGLPDDDEDDPLLDELGPDELLEDDRELLELDNMLDELEPLMLELLDEPLLLDELPDDEDEDDDEGDEEELLDDDSRVERITENGQDFFASLIAFDLEIGGLLFDGAVGKRYLLDRSHPAGAVGDLLTEVVAESEFFANVFDDVIGMGIVFGKDDRLGNVFAARKDLGEQLFFERLDDGSDLIGGDIVFVEFVAAVLDVLIEQGLTFATGLAAPFANVVTGINVGTLFGDASSDFVDVVRHVDAVGDGFFVRVFHHHVVVKERDGLLARCCGQPDGERVEVFQDIAPHAVDRPVTLVDDDGVEELRRNDWVVRNGNGRLVERAGIFKFGLLFVVVLNLGSTGQDGIEPLDRCDDDVVDGIECVLGWVLDVVELVEGLGFARRQETLELLERLASEVLAVNQEANAAGAAVAGHSVGDVGGGKGFAGPGRHLDQSLRLTQCE